MATLKSLRNRIKSVKSTQKITKAMKMVAAAKLRRAQEQAQAARPYAEKIAQMLSTLAVNVRAQGSGPELLVGRVDEQGNAIAKNYLLIVTTSDRGLCGAFNSSILRYTRNRVRELESEGKRVQLLILGKKGGDVLRGAYHSHILDTIRGISRRKPSFADADSVAKIAQDAFLEGKVDVVEIVYNKFISALSQQVTLQRLIPMETQGTATTGTDAAYEYEPSEEQILQSLLPHNLSVQIYRAILESSASEHGARMTAMDNATRNAGGMIKRLTLQYNRTRQAAITKELIEIISGAEAI